MNHCDFFKGKKITVLGLGLLGRGVGDTAFLSECGADLIVTDLKTEAELAPSLEQLKGYQNIQYVLGEHRREDFRNRDFILKNPDVPLNSLFIEEAEANNIPIEMSASLVAKLTDATIVGVTGTRGKSTVTQLIYHILHKAGLDVHLAGNVRGIATLPVLAEINKDSVIVMELDSWQLQGFGASKISPNISVFTTFYPDHMTYYHDDMQRYFDDKANIFMHQRKGGTLITTKQSHREILRYSNVVPNNETIVEPYETNNSSLLGSHNKENAACAVEVAKQLGISSKKISEAVENFKGVEGRLQFVREINGIKIYNDNNATSPEATIAALEALEKDIVLIVGGWDKSLKMNKLIDAIPKHCKAVVLFKENGTDRIRDEVMAMSMMGLEVYEEEGLENTVKRAFSLCKSGDTLLYSPAFASFGKYFKNEYDRNDQFLALAEKV